MDPEDYKVLLIIAGLTLYMQFSFTIKIKPTAWREFLGSRDAGKLEAPS